MNKYKLQLKTLSKVILSGRESSALYKGVDYSKEEKCNIIYPFYSYEDRMLKSDETYKLAKNYYIPGSSFKGALLSFCEDEDFHRIKTYDIPVAGADNIRKITLKKIQYLYYDDNKDGKNKEPKLKEFMPNVGVEVLKHNKVVETCIATTLNRDKIEALISRNNELNRKKLEKYINILDERLKYVNKKFRYDRHATEVASGGTDEALMALNNLKNRVREILLKDDILMFIGGYKGLNNSLRKGLEVNSTQTQKPIPQPSKKMGVNSSARMGFFVDDEVYLPYGIVTISMNG